MELLSFGLVQFFNQYFCFIIFFQTLAEPVSQVIKALVQLQSHTTPSDEGPVVTKLIVPSQRVGCIIGEGGTVISEMRRRTGAGIRVYTKEMRLNFLSPEDELVEVKNLFYCYFFQIL